MIWCCALDYPEWAKLQTSTSVGAAVSFYIDPHNARIVQTNRGECGPRGAD